LISESGYPFISSSCRIRPGVRPMPARETTKRPED
jgi:hypothetical protein